MRKIFLIVIFTLSLLMWGVEVRAQSNAGFVPSDIWLSQESFQEGDKIEIYTFIFNPENRELSGTVSFFDKTVLLGKKNFFVAPRGVKEISVDWTATVGDHKIYAKIENPKFLVSSGKYETALLEDNQTESISSEVRKKIEKTEEEEVSEEENILESSLESIEATIDKYTPDIISKPLIKAGAVIESVRASLGEASQDKKASVKEELKIMRNEKVSGESKPSPIQKPWKYVQLFFLTLFSFILNTKIAFYTFIVVIFYFLLRFIYRLVF